MDIFDELKEAKVVVVPGMACLEHLHIALDVPLN